MSARKNKISNKMLLSPLYSKINIKNSTMKKSLLIVLSLSFAFIVTAQKHVATALSARKVSGVGHSTTQKPGGAAACDTLKYDSAFNATTPWTQFYYAFPDNVGYLFGVSNADSLGYKIKEDANYYDVSGSDYSYITGGIAYFNYANSNVSTELSKNLVFKVYDDNGAGFPNNLLGSTTLKLSKIKDDVDNNLGVEFNFSSPIAIPANKIFYVSIDHNNFKWNATVRDSIAIIADSSDEAPAAAYQYIDQWYAVNQIWPADPLGQYPLDANLFLFPYVTNTISGCSTLPVSVFDFKGSINDNKALLTWSTATEFNNKGFAIERSKDGKTFMQIGFVNGAGTTTKRINYTYADATLSDFGIATFYYRLKQVDLDGKTSYSNVIPLSLKDIVSWKLYPNPVKDKLTVELNLAVDTKVNAQIISKDGKLLLNADKGMLPQGQQQLIFNTQNLASGSYFIRIKAGDKNYTETIIKQ